jgi:hypothetical protein
MNVLLLHIETTQGVPRQASLDLLAQAVAKLGPDDGVQQ